ncbi:TPA: Hsp20/alpha crystallin family protein [Legionella pneumophila]|uniref:Hsp20/alpha crystallin family protein n=1 Tax=Legionella pneumophila TaxID=446 RepID=UPI000786CAA6|nr:Hsp20/alpha crystallin family protein [Legionella pneumophila]HBD7102744.1 Hsp20/alpha crystallin family protein [Legionella pneumophila]HCO4739474.1 Hsp20/alpha crystallin family protein [Legionella pneumophila]HEG4430062.1 Hsp20/alpha crystallin family protein [Legionella pneumophila]HEG4433121.1 Hsp20/alpha crystallin family protein [Legionella pneumophila]HEN5654935.1 Hsp20/alpha crystallin family protein [Legionella pneumophila]
MKNKLLPNLIIIALAATISTNSMTVQAKQNDKIQNSNEQLIQDPFDTDPFFQSHDDVLQQMHKMQQAMDRFIKSQFSQMQNSLASEPHQNLFGSAKNIQITENKDQLIYKIKLPQGADSKVDVSVKNGQLVVSANVTQKITHEEANNKSVSYSQSNYMQSFQLPHGYDPNSMVTKMKDSNLIVTFKKHS